MERGRTIGKEKTKLSVEDKIVYLENPRESIINSIKELNKAGYKTGGSRGKN